MFKFKISDKISLSNDNWVLSPITIHYNRIPNTYSILCAINSNNFWEYLNSNYSISDTDITVNTTSYLDEKNIEHNTHIYLIHLNQLDIFLHFYVDDYNADSVDCADAESKTAIYNLTLYYAPENSTHITETLVGELKKMSCITKLNDQFNTIIYNDQGAFELKSNKIRVMNTDIGLHYGIKFQNKYANIVDQIKTCDYGLYLFSGEPGTGKTTLIRKLIGDLSDQKTFIYVPSYMVYEIANPALISFISKYNNSVIILEDADDILTSTERTQAISNILNLSDGLLNDAIKMQFIITFNVEQTMIDKALLRAGRLKANHRFAPLNVEEANRLAKHLNINVTYTKPTVIADIYNTNSANMIELDTSVKKIGF